MLPQRNIYSNAWLVGSSGGIGRELLRVIQKHSKNVVAGDIRGVNNKKNQKTAYFKVDCSEKKQLDDFARVAINKYGSPDLLVIAAGEVISKSLEDSNEDELDRIYRNNFKLVVLMLQKFFEVCDRRNSVIKNIVIISSNAASEARPNQPIYAAMKSAINSLVQTQAVSWGINNIKINVIAPGTVVVNRNRDFLMQKYKNFPLDPSRPSGKILFPRNLFPALEFLLYKDLNTTGQILIIDGGSNLV
jgi:NAD(P)-dependent dehydrogenase (short-subunit alcohol dehydrogenase family)